MDKLNLLKVFVAVVDRGSFVNAAAALALSPSAVSKAITRLEEDLHIQLVFRSTRSIKLTSAGSDYAQQARAILQSLDDCESRLQNENQEPRGTLRLNLPVSYGRQYIVPLLKNFCHKYPDIKLNISFDDGYVDMIEQGIDVTIRTGRMEDSNLVARQLSPMDFLVCASPDFLEGRAAITPDTYDQHPWVRFRFRQSGRLNQILVKKGKRVHYQDPGQDYIVDDGETAAEMAARGMGLVQLPHFVARRWIDSGQLRAVTPYVRSAKFGVFMVYAKRQYLPARIKLFTQFLEQAIREKGETPRSTWAEDLVLADKQSPK